MAPRRKSAPPAPEVSEFDRVTNLDVRPGQETSGSRPDTFTSAERGYDPLTGQPPPAEDRWGPLDDCLKKILPSGAAVGVDAVAEVAVAEGQSKSQLRRQVAGDLLAMRANIPWGEIETTRLTLMNFDQLRNSAVCRVSIPSAEVKANTVNDPRMGPIHKGLCETCAKDVTYCLNHNGFIEFNRMIHHPLFIEETLLVLQSVNRGCGKLRLTPNQIREANLNRLSGITCLRMFAEVSQKQGFCDCTSCGGKNEIVYDPVASKARKAVVYKLDKKSKTLFTMPVEEVFAVLSSLSNEDAAALGFTEGARPEDMIMRGMAVVGPATRPPTIENGEMRNEHLTSMYIDIVKHNNLLADATLSEVQREDTYVKFKNIIDHFINNSDRTYSQGHNQPYKGIQQRLQGKTELRAHGMGKRVNFSARTVIGPSVKGSFGEVVVPEAFASKLLYPVRVFNLNLAVMRHLWRQGRITHITSASGPLRGVKREVNATLRERELPQIGDELERWLQDGDYVFNNRQPTIHSLGFRAFRVVLGKYKTTGVRLEDTKSFNADFDGDEMNLHVPRSIEALAEAMVIANTIECQMNAQNDAPAVGFKLDVVSSFRAMTLENKPVDRADFCDCVMFLTVPVDLVDLAARAKHFDMPFYSTRVLFSALLPPDFFYENLSDEKNPVRINRGILVSGAIGDDDVGSKGRSIMHFLWKRYGKARSAAWFTDANNLALRWQSDVNLTFGLSQCLPRDPKEHANIISTKLGEAKAKIAALGPAPTEPLAAEKHEAQIRAHINIAGTVGAAIESQYDKDNPLFIMVKSGAKGNKGNVSQITSMLGQQYLRGQRLVPKKAGGRTLSYFEPGDTDLLANGFIASSFLTGMSGPEFFFHMMAGREGLVDTALTTATVGSMNHKLVKALEDLRVAEDGSVRNATGGIISALYGADGMGGGKLMRRKLGDESIATFLDVDHEAKHLNSQLAAVLGA